MAYEFPTKEAAEAFCTLRNAEHDGFRYAAELYPNGQIPPAQWKYAGARYQPGYHKDGSERFHGFVWRTPT